MKAEARVERVTTRLREVLGDAVSVQAVEPLTGGACQDNFRVSARVGDAERTWCLRSDARTALPASVPRRVEFAVIQAAVAAGVPTAAAHWLSPDLVREGGDAYFLDWIDGQAIGARVTRHRTLAAARDVLPEQLADALARIHSITPESHPDLPIERPPFDTADPARAAVAFVGDMLDRLDAPRPASEAALRWLRANAPTPAPRTLVHADFRTGNFMVGPEGLRAVLDWEFTHFGDPMEDIGWLCTRDWRFGQIEQPVGGICGRDRFYAAYEKASGRRVDRARIRWWEICGNLRWGVAAAFQGKRFAMGEPEFELLAIPRRAAEMEYEALRLVELTEQGG